MPDFHCDLAQHGTPFIHFWEHTVGSGRALLALRTDWQAQLKQCHQELGFQYIRFHGLLSDDMDTLILHQDEFLYSFFNVDRIFDFLLSIGMRPFVELSFMPAALASGHKTVFKYQGNVTPPKEYKQWGQLIHRLVFHCVDRYGLEEVRQWFFEVWNEPNLPDFWTGTQEAYFKLYREAAETIKAIDPFLQVGGPATAKNEWIEEFLDFCQAHHVPVDFVTTHHYPTDAFGNPGDDTESQLAESERSVLQRQAQDARRQTRGKPLYYTEWNSSSNSRDPLHDGAYCAAFAVKTIMEAQGVVEGYSFWTFSDIFEEIYFPSQPFHGGFGLLNLYGIPKPVYRAYELLHRSGDEQLLVDGRHDTVDAWVIRGEGQITLFLTNHALPRYDISVETVNFHLTQSSRPHSVMVTFIDEDHANPRRAWEQWGEPPYLTPGQVDQLQQASRLEWQPLFHHYRDDDLYLTLKLQPQAVAAIVIKTTEL